MDWTLTQGRISCRGAAGGRVFDDSIDHWENGICRLLGLSDEQARAWVESSVRAGGTNGEAFERLAPDHKLRALAHGARHVLAADYAPSRSVATTAFPHLEVLGERVDTVWVSGIREDVSVAVVGSSVLEHGVLVHTPEFGGGPVQETIYEEDYFEGQTHGVGYGDYGNQKEWRMEKSRRHARQIVGISSLMGRPLDSGSAILDVGSGYGYFRRAVEELGFDHEGLDVSRHAAEVARADFGFDTFVGPLKTYVQQAARSFDLVCLFDTVEHVADPVELIGAAAAILKPGGLLAVRTPNLNAIEFEVFGRYYHSLKLEHLHYFSGRSLCWVFAAARLIPGFLTTESHLLQGFIGEAAAQSYARTLRGSDLFAVGYKPG